MQLALNDNARGIIMVNNVSSFTSLVQC